MSASIALQAAARSQPARAYFHAHRRAAVRTQAGLRGWHARFRMRRARWAAVRLQAAGRLEEEHAKAAERTSEEAAATTRSATASKWGELVVTDWEDPRLPSLL